MHKIEYRNQKMSVQIISFLKCLFLYKHFSLNTSHNYKSDDKNIWGAHFCTLPAWAPTLKYSLHLVTTMSVTTNVRWEGEKVGS